MVKEWSCNSKSNHSVWRFKHLGIRRTQHVKQTSLFKVKNILITL
uniref:Uncharacterized protein n=1 Tax=Anguilla anguilla TaxID=7936 RepID=A0A0E9S278_ANGAN